MILQLKAFMALAEKVYSRSTSLPILNDVCIDKGTIRITDIENTLVMPFKDNRQYCLPLEVLKQVLKTNPSEIRISLLEDDKVEIQFDLHSVVCPTRSAEEYPTLPKGDFTQIGIWSREIFGILHKQMNFASNDELKPAMTGICVSQNGSLQSCATDGHVLQYIDDLDPEHKCHLENPFNGILARKTVALLSQVPTGKIMVSYSPDSPGYLKFELLGDMVLYSRLIDEQFPEYESILAESKANQVKVDRKDLLNALRIADKFAGKSTHQGIVNIRDGLMTLSANDLDRNLEFETNIPTLERLGDEMKIGFNLKLLEQVISALPENEILWRYSNPVSANLFSGIGNPNVQNLIMPVRLEED